VTVVADALERGRAAFERQAWGDAYAALSSADEQSADASVELDAEDLLRLANAAALTGHEAEGDEVQARAYQAFVDRGDLTQAARCAFWLGSRLFSQGDPIRGRSWYARAQRLLDDVEQDCVEHGLLCVASARQTLEAGDPTLARTTFEQARQIGERFGDADLIALARLGVGVCQVSSGYAADGLAYLDDVMLSVEMRQLSPVVVGALYCVAIDVCHDVFDLRRAQEWTVALARWCAAQPDLVPFRGQCQVHRAQVLQLHGAWPAAMEIAESIAHEDAPRAALPAVGPAFYQKGELHRLRGEFSRAEEAYRMANRRGFAPEPGLALLRLSQGQLDVAAGSISRALAEATPTSRRTRLLPAYVEIMLAVEDVPAAHRGAEELARRARELDAPFVEACASYALGAVLLAEGDAQAAIRALHVAQEGWQALEAPYESARTRELMGLARRELGDVDGARLELDAAAWALRQLGATSDIARIEAETRPRPASTIDGGGLTQREVQVLRLIAAGRTNRAIAAELVLSEKTVARHVSNIFTKLGLSSRSAATAYAYEHALV
jgi:DNA-binding CsgD family transcriptional regulator